MSEENLDIPMAQCGACNSIVPLDSEVCPDCGVRFAGVTDDQLGECGACGSIIPVDSESCAECGASFVAVEEPASEEPIDDISEMDLTEDLDELNEIILPESEEHLSTEDITDSTIEETSLEDLETEVEIEEQVIDSEEEIPDADADHSVNDEAEIDSSISEVEEQIIEEVPEDTEVQDSIAEDELHSENEEAEPVEEETDEDAESDEESHDDAPDEVEEDESEEDTTVDEEEAVDDQAEDDTAEDEEETTADEEETVDDGIDDVAVAMAFDNLALAIADSGMTAAEAFGEIDTSDDHLIDAPELQKGIEKIAGEKLSPKHVTAILNHLDKDGNRRIDPNELIKALEDLRIGIQPGKIPKIKTFPSPVQKFLMSKKANDIFYPIAYFLVVTFIGIWVVNGVGLLVDGTGGTIVYEGGVDQFGDDIEVTNWNLCQSDALEELPDPCFGTVEVGQTYPCDPAVDENKCANSLTPFSGENGASSMPAGFYLDGILMIVLGVVGLGLTAFLHLIYAPALREKAKEKSGKTTTDETDEDDESEEEVEEDEDDSEDEESALDAPDNLVIEDEEDQSEDDEEDDDEEDDEIDIGTRVGVEDDDGDWFGIVVEFDEDDDSLVIIKSEDDDEEYEVEWDMLFMPDDEDDE